MTSMSLVVHVNSTFVLHSIFMHIVSILDSHILHCIGIFRFASSGTKIWTFRGNDSLEKRSMIFLSGLCTLSICLFIYLLNLFNLSYVLSEKGMSVLREYNTFYISLS